MAEERLIDDDKDRKYKIRKNADGEDELVIDDTPDDEDESDIPVFDIPVYIEDDEEAAVLTPEQLAERERLKREEETAREQKLNSAMQTAEAKLAEGDFESALYALKKVEHLAGGNAKFYCLKLKTLTRNFTDYLSLEGSAEAADGVKEYADAESKAELSSLADGYRNKIAETEQTVSALHEENEKKKEERRAVFAERKAKATRNLLITAGPLLLLLILTITFSTMMYSAENGTYLILTIVFAALTVVVFACTLFTLNKFLEANRNVKLNEKDTSTKLGREYLKNKTDLELLKRIISSFENDLS